MVKKYKRKGKHLHKKGRVSVRTNQHYIRLQKKKARKAYNKNVSGSKRRKMKRRIKRK